MRITRVAAIALGGFVSLVAAMSVVGFVTDNVWVRLVVGLTLVLGLPAVVADRLLKRTDATLATRGSLAMVADVFAIVLLGVALVVASAESVTRGLFAREGDRYARSGSTFMARAVYFVGGLSPVFSAEKGAAAGARSAPASASK